MLELNKRLVTIGILAVLVIVAAIICVPIALAAGGSGSNHDVIVGPINVIRIIDPQVLSVDENPNKAAMEPGDPLPVATVVYQVTNLTDRVLYVTQNWWTENPLNSEFPSYRVEYIVQGAEPQPGWSNVFALSGRAVMMLTVKLYVSIDSPPSEGTKVHFQEPRLFNPAFLNSGGNG